MSARNIFIYLIFRIKHKQRLVLPIISVSDFYLLRKKDMISSEKENGREGGGREIPVFEKYIG